MGKKRLAHKPSPRNSNARTVQKTHVTVVTTKHGSRMVSDDLIDLVIDEDTGKEKFYWWEFGRPRNGMDEMEAISRGIGSAEFRHRVIIPVESDKRLIRAMYTIDKRVTIKPWKTLDD